MRPTPALVLSLCICASSYAEPGDPQPMHQTNAVNPGEVTATSTEPAPPPSVTASPTASTKAESDTKKREISDERAKALRSAGYRPEVRNGETLYCRREAVLGTRLEKKVCGSAEEIELSTRNSQELANRIQQKAFSKPPGSP